AASIQPWLVGLRRQFHQVPELMYEEIETGKLIRQTLDDLGITYRQIYDSFTGIVASIGPKSPSVLVALRADMDALPINEQTGLAFSSKVPGKMHACGHDSHVTMLLGAAKLLKAHEKDLPGGVRLIFQPAEEGGAGGDLMVKEGAVKDVAAIFGLHVYPFLQSGALASRAGPLMGACQQFEIRITGAGGHAAMPHFTVDPIVAAANTISALQVLVSRETSPLGTAVVSVTKIAAGEGAYNVIPDSATFGGTLRSLAHEHLMYLKQRMEEVVKAQAQSHKCSATVDWLEKKEPYYPPTVNDRAMYNFAVDVGKRLQGDFLEDFEPTLGGEDFSFYGHAGVPAAFTFLGIQNETAGSVHGLHTPRFMLDEEVLQTGAAYLASLASEYL
ncbi:amidohydrolase, partial [Coccomyxa subellipsoidea C-169]